jgi:chromosome segregation ATPase
MVTVQVSDDLARRFERCVKESGESKSSALRSQIREYCDEVEGTSPEQLRSLIEEKKEEKEELEGEQQRLSDELSNLDADIQQLQSQLEDLQSRDIEELRETLVADVDSGARLSVIAESTDKVEEYRRLAGLDSVEEVIKEIHEYADTDTESVGDAV